MAPHRIASHLIRPAAPGGELYNQTTLCDLGTVQIRVCGSVGWARRAGLWIRRLGIVKYCYSGREK